MPADGMRPSVATVDEVFYEKRPRTFDAGRKAGIGIGMSVAQLQKTPVTRFQIFGLAALAGLNMQDGFDILAISYSAQAIAEDWSISTARLGIVLSAAVFGMMLGLMFLGSLADRIGRRPVVVAGLFLSGIGMLVAAAASSIDLLILGRVLTGFGVGGILASLNTLVAEFAGERYRGRAVAIFQLGFPLGAFLSGFAVAWLLDVGSWRHVFLFGAATSFLFIPIMLALPESMEFLARSGRTGALQEINRTRAKLGEAPLSALPAPNDEPRHYGGNPVLELFSPTYRLRTVLLWASFFFLLTTLYFLLSWVPKLLIEMGYTADQGNRAGRLINLAGMGGIVLIGVASVWIRPSLITGGYLLVLSAALVFLSGATGSYPSLVIGIAVTGFVIHGAMIGLYATTPALYPAGLRATGMGWAIGLSRFGAVLGPLFAGFILEAGWSPAQLLLIFAAPSLLAAAMVWMLWREEVRRGRNV